MRRPPRLDAVVLLTLPSEGGPPRTWTSVRLTESAAGRLASTLCERLALRGAWPPGWEEPRRWRFGAAGEAVVELRILLKVSDDLVILDNAALPDEWQGVKVAELRAAGVRPLARVEARPTAGEEAWRETAEALREVAAMEPEERRRTLEQVGFEDLAASAGSRLGDHYALWVYRRPAPVARPSRKRRTA